MVTSRVRVSGDFGNYTLELSPEDRQCLGYAPLVVDLPAGAIDTRMPGTANSLCLMKRGKSSVLIKLQMIRNGDNSSYRCDSKEGVITAWEEKTYELTNLVNKEAGVFADCQAVDFTTETYMRYAFIEYSDGTADYSSQFMFFPPTTDLIQLNDWLGLKAQLESLDPGVLINTFEGLPYGFMEVGMSGASSWHKQKFYPDGENAIRLYKNDSGQYEKWTTFADGTSLKGCSTDGVNWKSCS